MTITFAVISTAEIAKAKVVPALQAVPSVLLVGISSRDKQRAQLFVDEHVIAGSSTNTHDDDNNGNDDDENNNSSPPICVGMTHDEVLETSLIDAVYVPLPSRVRSEFILNAIQCNKHYLF